MPRKIFEDDESEFGDEVPEPKGKLQDEVKVVKNKDLIKSLHQMQIEHTERESYVRELEKAMAKKEEEEQARQQKLEKAMNIVDELISIKESKTREKLAKKKEKAKILKSELAKEKAASLVNLTSARPPSRLDELLAQPKAGRNKKISVEKNVQGNIKKTAAELFYDK